MTLTELAQQLREQQAQLAQKRVVAGFDGFVDELVEAIDERRSETDYTCIDSMQRFGQMISAASGRSSLNEINIRSADAGGCSVNLSDGLNSAGVKVDYYGSLGKPMHPAFEQFAQDCRSCSSWLDGHGLTLALEFNDGKYMLAAMGDLYRFTPAVVQEQLSAGNFKKDCMAADVIVMNNWTLYPHMTACWKLLNQQVYSELTQTPYMFIDLVNPSSRSKEDCLAALDCLTVFQKTSKCVLGLNLNEADIVSALIGGPLKAAGKAEAVLEQTQFIRDYLGIHEVVTHGVQVNCVAGDGYSASGVIGPYCENPKKSTGAGDRFNAGYCLGLMLEQCLQLGVATSGHFIRNAKSASSQDIIQFLENWGATD